MDIPIGAQVVCTDGPCGRSTYIVLNPVTDNITHFVAEESTLPYIERLVPINEIQKSDPQNIYLRCSRLDFEKMEPFIETDFIRADIKEYSVPFTYPSTTPLLLWPYMSLPDDTVIVRLEHIPPSELAVRRGAQVRATDGYVGEVEEFIVNPKNGHITHLVLRKGHLWGEKDITIPVSEIDHIDENDVYLKIDKFKIASMSAVPVKRRW
jgi:sporulation protein YlmC with PRC-barrel domain